MKKTTFTFKAAVLSLIVGCVMASCSDKDESTTRSFGGYFTIFGENPNYTLVDDGGNVFYPTAESVNSLTQSKGFGTNKRAELYGSYEETSLTKNEDGTYAIKNVSLYSGQYIITANALMQEEAEKLNVLTTDSIFPVRSFNNCWVANGYLNTIVTGEYSAKDDKAVRPTLNLYVDQAKVKDNEIVFTLLYNRHSSKNVSPVGNTDFMNSFDVTHLNIPGTDSIMVQVDVQGSNSFKTKVARKAFLPYRR